MAFEKYVPHSKTSEPEVVLRKAYIGFNVPASKIIKWKRVNIAVDKLNGQIAISEAKKDEGLIVTKNNEFGQKHIAGSGIIKYFGLQRLINQKYSIKDDGDMLLLTPKSKLSALPSFKNNT
jgi:hypothetical protein